MGDAKKDLYWVIFFLIILAVVWHFTGGPERPASFSGPILFKPQETHSKELQEQIRQIGSGRIIPIVPVSTSTPNNSIYSNSITLSVGSGAKQTIPQKQYVEIKASLTNNKPINITGWSLVGKTGLNIKIGQGTYLPYSAQVNPQENIFLNKGEKAVIITGESPIGTSFRLNKCTGYFTQFQTFYPALPKQCPKPIDENLPSDLNDPCLDYLEKLQICRMQISIPPALSPSCRAYINEKINYATCVEEHKNDSDFYKPEWRIYLGRKETLWKEKRETIILSDQNNKIIDWVSY